MTGNWQHSVLSGLQGLGASCTGVAGRLSGLVRIWFARGWNTIGNNARLRESKTQAASRHPCGLGQPSAHTAPASLTGSPTPNAPAGTFTSHRPRRVGSNSSSVGFAELTQRRLRRGVFTNATELVTPSPLGPATGTTTPTFVWHKAADEIIDMVRRGRTALHETKSATRFTSIAPCRRWIEVPWVNASSFRNRSSWATSQSSSPIAA